MFEGLDLILKSLFSLLFMEKKSQQLEGKYHRTTTLGIGDDISVQNGALPSSMICLTGDTIRRIDIVSSCFEKKNNNCCETKFVKMPFVYYLQIYKSTSGYSAAWTSWHQCG